MQDGRKRFRGILAGVEGDEIRLNDEGKIWAFRFHHLSDARLMLTDELIAEDLRRAKARGDDSPEIDESDLDDAEAGAPSKEE